MPTGSAEGGSGGSDLADVVLTFVDADGNEWIAAAHMSALKRVGGREYMPVAAMEGRSLAVKEFKVVVPDE